MIWSDYFPLYFICVKNRTIWSNPDKYIGDYRGKSVIKYRKHWDAQIIPYDADKIILIQALIHVIFQWDILFMNYVPKSAKWATSKIFLKLAPYWILENKSYLQKKLS